LRRGLDRFKINHAESNPWRASCHCFCNAAVPGVELPQRLAARPHHRLDARGGTPPKLAGADARATFSPDDFKNRVKMHPNPFATSVCHPADCIRFLIWLEKPAK
jgi:hypothetical protein